MDELQRHHNIHAIIAQIKSENQGENSIYPALRQAGKPRQYAARLDVPYISRNSGDYWKTVAGKEAETEDQIIQHQTVEVRQPPTTSDAEIIETVHRNTELRFDKNPPRSSKQPITDKYVTVEYDGKPIAVRRIFFW